MQNEVSEVVDLQYYCTVKVHRLMCLDLKKLVNRISQIFPAIESARPGCASGRQALCTLHRYMEKANLLVWHCSESSKLYLAITGYKIVLRCEQIRNALELCLSQIQNMVPSSLAAQISKIVDDLRIATFTVESSEDEAGKAVLALLQQDIPASGNANTVEIKTFQVAALRLHITSPLAILIEKRSIKKLLGKIHDTDPRKKVLNYLLYLLRKYGRSIGPYETESIGTQNEETINQLLEPESLEKKASQEVQADVVDTIEPPEEFKCPLSMRLMHEPVIIANGQTFERLWIEKWFSEGHETCPKTHKKLFDLSMTPNFAIKDLISIWCMDNGITVLDPCSHSISSHLRLPKNSSSSSIASFGSSIKGMGLQVSNVSFRSSDTNNALDSLDTNTDDGVTCDLLHINADPANNSPGIRLSFLTKLSALPWASQSKAVKDVKNQLKDNQGCQSMDFTSYIKPLIVFLKDAHDLHDSKSQRNGAELLLTFLKGCRSEMLPLHEDAFYIFSSYLNSDSDITEEVLAIMEVLSRQQYYKSKILPSGVLPSILRLLENQISKFHLPAMKLLCNVSVHTDIGHHLIYLDYIPKLAPFLGDRVLAAYCLKIYRNLCNIEEAQVEVADSDVCIASIAEILEIGNADEQELAMDILRSLCYQREEFCKLLMKESMSLHFVNIAANGNSRGKLIAMELLQLLKDVTDGHLTQECLIPSTDGPNPDVPQDSGNNPGEKKSSSKPKASGFLGMNISVFSKRRR